MTDIVLVRHAQTTWSGRRYCGRSDPPLDRAGRAAAGRVAADLRTWLPPGARLVSSPRRRAIETATKVSAALHGSPIEIDERWAETDFGIAEGLTFDQLAGASPDLAARVLEGELDIDWPAGEPAAGLAGRVADAWDALANSHAMTIVVVTHGGPIRVAAAFATGRPITALAVPPPGGTLRMGRAGPGEPWTVLDTP